MFHCIENYLFQRTARVSQQNTPLQWSTGCKQLWTSIVPINKTKTNRCHLFLPLYKTRENQAVDWRKRNTSSEQSNMPMSQTWQRIINWGPYITDIEIKAIKKMAVMKKLGGTRWGANSTILTQVYTGSVRPHMEYASNSWSTAAKTNTARLKKVQNTGLRLIAGGLKTTPIAALEKNTGLHSSEWRREDKPLRQTKKMKRLPSHPLYSQLQELTKHRLKRQSVNHFAKGLQRKHKPISRLRPYRTLQNGR